MQHKFNVCISSAQFHNLQELRHSASLVTKVFVQRDYSEGTVCRFQTKFPSELDNRVSTNTHSHTQANVICWQNPNSPETTPLSITERVMAQYILIRLLQWCTLDDRTRE